MTLEELKASAPRSFDKTLVDLLVSIQRGQQPIVTPEPQPVEVIRGPDVSPVIVRLASELEAANARIARLEAVIARLAMEAAAEAA